MPGDGVVTGFGLIDGRRVALFAQDFTVLGGSFSETQALKVGRLLETGDRRRAADRGAARFGRRAHSGRRLEPGRIRRPVLAEHAGERRGPADQRHARPLRRRRRVFSGPDRLRRRWCAGRSYMFITGPDVIRTVTGEEVDVEAPRRRRGARRAIRRRAFRRRRRRRRRSSLTRRLLELSAVEQRRGSAGAHGPRQRGARTRTRSIALIPDASTISRTMCATPSARLRIADRFSRCTPSLRRTRSSVSRGCRLGRGVRGEPAVVPRGRPRHQRLGQDRAVHPLRRCVQHPAS